jgi:hypothetical protein
MRFLTLAFLISVIAGCDDGAATPPTQPVPADLQVVGPYRLSSRIDVPPTVLASQTVVDYLALLRQLRTDPAAAFFGVLDEAGVPMASELLAALPSTLEDVLKGAINDYVGGQTSGAAGAEIDRLLALSEAAFAHFTLESQLDLPPGAELAAIAGTHTVQGLTLDVPGGLPVTVPSSALAALSTVPGVLVASPTVAVTGPGTSPGDASLSVGDHFFGLAYGEVVFAALDGYGTGQSLRSRLGSAFNCTGMGNWVAKRCVLGLCVGHASDVSLLCENALDLAVDKLHEKLAGMSFEAIRFAAGHGTLWDQVAAEAKNGIAERVDGGIWQASIDVGTGPRDCKAVFTGRR